MEQMALYVLGGNNQEDSESGSDATGRARRVDSSAGLGSDNDSVDWEHQHYSEISDSISPKDGILDEQSTVPDATEVPWTIPFDLLGALSLTATIIVFLNLASRLVSVQLVYPNGIPPSLTGMPTLDRDPGGPQSVLFQLNMGMKKQNTLGCLTKIERSLGAICDQALDLCRDLVKHGTIVDLTSNVNPQRLLAEFTSSLTQKLQAEFTAKIHNLRRSLQLNVLLPFG